MTCKCGGRIHVRVEATEMADEFGYVYADLLVTHYCLDCGVRAEGLPEGCPDVDTALENYIASLT